MPLLSIAENIFLGNEPAKHGVINWAIAFQRTGELLGKVGLKESPTELITNLGVGKQQLVEIAKALAKEVKLLILDEPTASLNESDSDALLNLLMEFRRQGISSILISHKLNEITKVADRITVLRDGATVDLMADQSGTRQAIEASLPMLRSLLADQGLRLAEARLDGRGDGSSTPSDQGRGAWHGESAANSQQNPDRATAGHWDRGASGNSTLADAGRGDNRGQAGPGDGQRPRGDAIGRSPVDSTPVNGRPNGFGSASGRRIDLYA